MEYKIDILKEKLKTKKIVTEEDKKKAEYLRVLLTDDQVFFKLTKGAAIGVLKFLEIPEDQIESFYADLISFDTYNRTYKL